MKSYILIGAGLFLSCTSAKLKTKYASNERVTVASDSLGSEATWHRYIAEDHSEYNALWWLKGNARWHPDSGLMADELLIRYHGTDERSLRLLDSQAQSFEEKKTMQQEASSQRNEKQKERENLFCLPWWNYVLFLLACYFFLRPKGKT